MVSQWNNNSHYHETSTDLRSILRWSRSLPFDALQSWHTPCTLVQHITSHYTQPFNGLWSGTTRVGRYQKKHPLTPILIIGHPLSSSIYNDQWHPLCSVYVLDSPLIQPLSRSSLVFHLVLDPQLHTPYISSPNHHLLFAAQAHTNAWQLVLLQYQCYVCKDRS